MNKEGQREQMQLKRIFYWFVLIVGCIFAFSSSYSQSVSRTGTTAAPFLKIGVGSRGLGMGEAYTTQAEDATAMYWNPAGLANSDKSQVVFDHYYYFADMSYNFGAISIPMSGIGTFGAFVSYFDEGSIERTTVTDPEGTGEQVNANSIAVGLSYSRMLTDRFSIGGNIKYIQETIWHSSATGVAFDVGVLYKAFFKNIKIGMSISNFGTNLQMNGRDVLVQHDINTSVEGNNPNVNSDLETDSYSLPVVFRVGISADILKDFLNVQEHSWILSIDAVHPNDNFEYVNMGTEVRLFNVVSLRTGYREMFMQDREGGLSFGVGVKANVGIGTIDFDYANVDFGLLQRQNNISIILSF
jgi:hypothetical protein